MSKLLLAYANYRQTSRPRVLLSVKPIEVWSCRVKEITLSLTAAVQRDKAAVIIEVATNFQHRPLYVREQKYMETADDNAAESDAD